MRLQLQNLRPVNTYLRNYTCRIVFSNEMVLLNFLEAFMRPVILLDLADSAFTLKDAFSFASGQAYNYCSNFRPSLLALRMSQEFRN